jgi:hypothetical protein
VSIPVTDAPRLLLLTLPGLTSEDVQSLEDTLKRVLAAALEYKPSTDSYTATASGDSKGFNGGKGMSPKAGTGGIGSRTRFDTARQKEQKEAFRDILRYTTTSTVHTHMYTFLLQCTGACSTRSLQQCYVCKCVVCSEW